MTGFYYVYILIDCTKTHYYVGKTQNLKQRLAAHNSGKCPHTSKFKPWKVKTAIAFDTEEKATAFESYLKSHSGRVFARRHF
jgi:putative endonuclease